MFRANSETAVTTLVVATEPIPSPPQARLTRSVGLLGASCILTGLQPAVAQTLVELGVDFSSVVTQRNLKRALLHCTGKKV
jgi:protein-arginine kinase